MIVVVDYGMGNVGSIANMLRKVGAEARISADHAVIESAGKLILPGVGAFDQGMQNLADRGLIPLLTRKVVEEKTPVLGVCLGMQLLAGTSEEGRCPGLGWLDAGAVKFRPVGAESRLKVPHMGWNTIKIRQPHPILAGLEEGSRFYFVHSYYVVCQQPDVILASTVYGVEFASAVAKDNIVGVQFHPEKSHRFGMQLYQNFAHANP
ncbi:MAG TPA: imidazole glycerol phosphate synthase subunit HisH [Gemmatimonadales bacterium]|nr:imidazole glycerol phosphate synthase subunit HisH [Gemmatimonadales bacterium]